MDNENTHLDSVTENIGSKILSSAGAYYFFDDVYVIPYDENLQVVFPESACRGDSVTLKAEGAARYDWYINGEWYSGDSIFTIEATENLTFSVKGYSDSLTHELTVIDCPLNCSGIPVIPNVFTPGHDNLNDTFFLVGVEAGCYTITILNRWGNVIFRGDESDHQWNGETDNGNKLTEGIYFYTIEVGSDAAKKSYRGFVNVYTKGI